MPFKKLNAQLKERLDDMGYNEPLPFQNNLLPKLKGGANVYAIAPKESGKTTILIIAIIYKLKAKAIGDSPRALIMVKDKQAALNLKEQFENFIKITNLRLYCAYQEHDLEKQREEIYHGVDILIATPQRLNKLYYLNSIHLGALQIFAIDDAQFLIRNNFNTDIMRVTESLQRCQYIILAEMMHKRYERFQNSFMFNSQIVSFQSQK